MYMHTCVHACIPSDLLRWRACTDTDTHRHTHTHTHTHARVMKVAWEEWDQAASVADILRVHEWDYVNDLQRKCSALAAGELGALDVDTVICADSYAAAAVAAGAACRAIDCVAAGPPGPTRVFVAVRPPGHHAGPRGRVAGAGGVVSSSQGFCLLNSVAIAAAYARCLEHAFSGP